MGSRSGRFQTDVIIKTIIEIHKSYYLPLNYIALHCFGLFLLYPNLMTFPFIQTLSCSLQTIEGKVCLQSYNNEYVIKTLIVSPVFSTRLLKFQKLKPSNYLSLMGNFNDKICKAFSGFINFLVGD